MCECVHVPLQLMSRNTHLCRLSVAPLYAFLPVEQQMRAFQQPPPGVRKAKLYLSPASYLFRPMLTEFLWPTGDRVDELGRDIRHNRRNSVCCGLRIRKSKLCG